MGRWRGALVLLAVPVVLAVAIGDTTLASFVDSESAAAQFSAATLPVVSPSVNVSATRASVSWNPAGWDASTYELARADDASGSGATTLYSGTGTSAVDAGGNAGVTQVLASATQVSVGTSYGCAVADGAVWCWGVNDHQQVGAASGSVVTTPIKVAGLPSAPSMISVGYQHACAVASGAAYCWGSDASGQLGNGVASGSTGTAVAVGGLSGKTVTAVAAGYESSCAVADQRAYCWGLNAFGEVGDGSTTQRLTATAVSLPAGRVDSVAVAGGLGGGVACAAMSGAAYCWGANGSGQLGNGTTTASATPVAVSVSGALSGRAVASVGVGVDHACAVTDTTIVCWGAGASGQLGNGAAASSLTPVVVSGLAGGSGVVVAAAGKYSCAGGSSGVWCWGAASTNALGTGAGANQVSPVAVTAGLSGVVVDSLAAADDHACVSGNGGVYCWGDNTSGELGTGAVLPSSSSTAVLASALKVPGCAGGASLSGGTCSLAPGTRYFWRLRNQLRGWTSPWSDWVGATTTSRPASTPSASAVTATSASITWPAYSPAGDQAGRYVLKRSANSDGSNSSVVYTGGGTSVTDYGGVLATLAPSAMSFSSLSTSTSYLFTCALASGGKPYCWGGNSAGELGNGTMTNSSTPVAVDTSGVLAGKTITGIAAGMYDVCVVTSDGKAYCWGSNRYGELGNGTTNSSSVPVAVSTSGALSGKTITSIAVGDNHTCALTSDGKAYCWGMNSYGQLGNNTTNDSSVPVAVSTSGVLSGKTVTSLTNATFDQTCVIASDGKLYCWGYNGWGQLGDGSRTNRSVPVAVSGMSGKTVIAATGGGLTTCALTSEGKAYCWGGGQDGGLGNGTTSTTPTLAPVAVTTSGVLSGKTVTSIVGGGDGACVRTSDGTVYCWGQNGFGAFGNGTTANSSVPVAVIMSGTLSGKTVTAIASGAYHTCALTSEQRLYCWGYNNSGQLGNGTTTDTSTPGAAIAGPPSPCPSGSSLATALTCTLTAGTTYYYQLSYSIGSWPGPSSNWMPVTTSSN